ncbi:MAG: AraC family transcriptional regulator [Pseudomonadota bacterium]
MKREAALRHRLNRAIDFAQSNVARPLDLDRMADVACLSKYHFARTFRAYVKEPPYHFVQRKRLEQAARSLAYLGGKPITEIALDSGFANSQAFSNAFRQRYGVSPRGFRARNRWRIGSVPDIGQTAEILAQSARPLPDLDTAELTVRIEARPAIRMAYVRHFGPYFNVAGGISTAFALIERWAKKRGLWSGETACIGLCPDNAALTPAGSCLYDAGIAVPAEVQEDDLASLQTIPAGLYAVLPIACPSARVNHVWDWLAAHWLPGSGWTYDLQDCYEVYPAWHGLAGRPETGVELCMRLKPRTAL